MLSLFPLSSFFSHFGISTTQILSSLNAQNQNKKNDKDWYNGLTYKQQHITANRHVYFGEGTLTIKLINHTTTDPMTQPTRKNTKSPAKIVRRGGPWEALPVSFTSDPSLDDFPPPELGFVAETVNSFRFICNFLEPMHLDNTVSKRGYSLIQSYNK